MGIVGNYLDLLPADARERIRSARYWTTRAYVDLSGARDLLGHAENWSWPDPRSVPICGAPSVFALREAAGDDLWTLDPRISARFARLVKRRGMEAAVRTICARLDGVAPRVNSVHRRGHLALVR
jgi:hypothetical protein